MGSTRRAWPPLSGLTRSSAWEGHGCASIAKGRRRGSSTAAQRGWRWRGGLARAMALTGAAAGAGSPSHPAHMGHIYGHGAAVQAWHMHASARLGAGGRQQRPGPPCAWSGGAGSPVVGVHGVWRSIPLSGLSVWSRHDQGTCPWIGHAVEVPCIRSPSL